MGRTMSLVGMVMFTVGVLALSSLARRTPVAAMPNRRTPVPEPLRRRVIPAFAYDCPFSLN